MKRISTILALILCTFALHAQFDTGPSVRLALGEQTTNNKYLIILGDGAPGWTPAADTNAYLYVDTTASLLYQYSGGTWNDMLSGLGNENNTSTDYLPYWDGDSWEDSPAFADIGNGRIGIGTTSPDKALDIEGSGANSTIKIDDTGSGAPALEMYVNGTNDAWSFFVDRTSKDFNIREVYTGSSLTNTDRLTIEQGGNVGIKTTTPSATLDINGNLVIQSVTTDNTNTDILALDPVSGEVELITDNAFQSDLTTNNTSTGYLPYWDGDSWEDLFLFSSDRIAQNNITTDYIPYWDGDSWEDSPVFADIGNGRIGIGTTSPDKALDIEGSGANSTIKIDDTGSGAPALEMYVNGTNDAWSFFVDRTSKDFNIREVYTGSSLTNIDRFTIEQGGNVTTGANLTQSTTSGSIEHRVTSTDANGRSSSIFVNDDGFEYLIAGIDGTTGSFPSRAYLGSGATDLYINTNFTNATGGTEEIFFKPGGYNETTLLTLTPNPDAVTVGANLYLDVVDTDNSSQDVAVVDATTGEIESQGPEYVTKNTMDILSDVGAPEPEDYLMFQDSVITGIYKFQFRDLVEETRTTLFSSVAIEDEDYNVATSHFDDNPNLQELTVMAYMTSGSASNYTLTIPAASTLQNKKIRVKFMDDSGSYAYTIDCGEANGILSSTTYFQSTATVNGNGYSLVSIYDEKQNAWVWLNY